MNKEQYIKSLENVKLVLGNGFDLHCGLYAKYSDFYCANFDKYNALQKLFNKFKNEEQINLNDIDFNNVNVWDIFFILNSNEEPYKNTAQWCDIEKLMTSSFMSFKEKSNQSTMVKYMMSNIHWEEIRGCINKDSTGNNDYNRFLILFIKTKIEKNKLLVSNFYSFLLDELKQFERDFGDFIYNQFHDQWFELNMQRICYNKKYIDLVSQSIKEMCNPSKIVSIDSFNFSNIGEGEFGDKYQNINGNFEAPIFGIDSIFKPEDERFIFTKTSRRIEFDLCDEDAVYKEKFDNLIIYGHSLNEADYSYFFPIFDQLKLLDYSATYKIIFEYSVYDKNKEQEIKSKIRKSIFDLFTAYAKSKQLKNPNRFLDSLSTTRRVVTYEIPDINFKGVPFTNVDAEWARIYKHVDEEKRKEEMIKQFKKEAKI